jgi:hypothetical protein
VVREHYLARPGYVNYYFNQLHRDRVWKALVARGDYSALSGAWTLSGKMEAVAVADDFKLEASAEQASIKLPAGELKIDLAGSLAGRLDPPGSGGLLTSVALWRRLLTLGPEKFGEVYYLGTAPLEGRDKLADVLVGLHGDVECRFFFDADSGQLAAMEMSPEEDSDPCELNFSEFQEVEGRILPGRIEVRHGDSFKEVFHVKQYDFAPAAAAPDESEHD